MTASHAKAVVKALRDFDVILVMGLERNDMSPKKKSIKQKPAPKKQEPKKSAKKSLGEVLKSKGLKKLPVRKPNPLPLRPEILLHPNIPKPLHGVNPRTIYGTNWWNRERLKTYKTTEFHCAACGVHKSEARSRQWMEGHEIYEIDYQKGRAVFKEVVPLCHYCHNYIHDGRMTHLLEKGLLHHAKFVAVIKHGDAVLRRAGLERQTHAERELAVQALEAAGKLCKWPKWRLILDGKEHEPIYKSYAEWVQAMSESDGESDE